jgi:hypothetical protein
VNKPDQSASVLFQAHTPDDGSIFLPVSVYLGISHSLVLLFFFFFFFALFKVYFMLFSLSFPRLFPAAFLCTPSRKKKVLSASRWPKLLPSTKKANWAPAHAQNFQEITMESMPVLPLEESSPNTLIYKNYCIKLYSMCLHSNLGCMCELNSSPIVLFQKFACLNLCDVRRMGNERSAILLVLHFYPISKMYFQKLQLKLVSSG